MTADQHWDYSKTHGPSTWGRYFPDADGDRQSPIDIKTSAAKHDPLLANKALKISYPGNKPYLVTNKGLTIAASPIVRGHDKHVYPPFLQGGPLDQKYLFDHFHIHWGAQSDRGSEHTVNGHPYAAEIHFVHYSHKFMDMKTAVCSEGGLAVIGVLVKPGPENPELKKMIDSIARLEHKDGSVDVTDFSLSSLLPKNCTEYWTYYGSLTTPPCYESVNWIVLKEPITVSDDQLKALRSLKTHCHEDEAHPGSSSCILDNFRPTQPLNDRTVRASFSKN